MTQDELNYALKLFMKEKGCLSAEKVTPDWSGHDHADFKFMMAHRYNVPANQCLVPTSLEAVHEGIQSDDVWKAIIGAAPEGESESHDAPEATVAPTPGPTPAPTPEPTVAPTPEPTAAPVVQEESAFADAPAASTSSTDVTEKGQSTEQE